MPKDDSTPTPMDEKIKNLSELELQKRLELIKSQLTSETENILASTKKREKCRKPPYGVREAEKINYDNGAAISSMHQLNLIVDIPFKSNYSTETIYIHDGENPSPKNTAPQGDSTNYYYDQFAPPRRGLFPSTRRKPKNPDVPE